MASAALQALAAGCAASGIDVLTVMPPVGEKEVFESALASIEPSALRLHVCAAQDGREELLEAVRRLSIQAQAGRLAPEKIDAHEIENALNTRGLPPVDLLISTGGGEKLCGALLWQCAYAELLFLDVPWFSLTHGHVDAALADYAKRCRKFGGLG
jgi:undecaprenyl diphosphate synthase